MNLMKYIKRVKINPAFALAPKPTEQNDISTVTPKFTLNAIISRLYPLLAEVKKEQIISAIPKITTQSIADTANRYALSLNMAVRSIPWLRMLAAKVISETFL